MSQRELVFVFAPEEQNVYSEPFTKRHGAPKERNVCYCLNAINLLLLRSKAYNISRFAGLAV